MLSSRDCELPAVGDISTSARFSSGKSTAEAASLSSTSLEMQRLRCPNRPAPAATSRNRRLVYPGTAGPPIPILPQNRRLRDASISHSGPCLASLPRRDEATHNRVVVEVTGLSKGPR